MEIWQKFSTTLNSQFILLFQDVVQQYFRHLTNFFFLNTKFGNKNCQNSKVIRSNVGFGDVMEHLRDIHILVFKRIEANIDDEWVKSSQYFIWRRFAEESFKLLNQEGWIFINLQEANNWYYFVEGKQFGMLFFNGLCPIYPNFSQKRDESNTQVIQRFSFPLINLGHMDLCQFLITFGETSGHQILDFIIKINISL